MAMHDQINSVYISIRLNTHHIPIKKLGIGSLVSSSLAFYGQRSSNRKWYAGNSELAKLNHFTTFTGDPKFSI